MPAKGDSSNAQDAARATVRTVGAGLEVMLEGSWRLGSAKPRWAEVAGPQKPDRVVLRTEGVTQWDTSLLLFIEEVRRWCAQRNVAWEDGALPAKMRALTAQLDASAAASVAKDRSPNLLEVVGVATSHLYRELADLLRFVGECALGAMRLALRPASFRWGDCLSEMQQCGAMALPIVSLIALLVGITIAYTGAVVLRKFGGDIYVADLLGVSMTREMGAMMTGVVVAGRTGAAFAAQLGSMKANEEIDALTVLGIPAVRFLVIPRLLALALMMPLLAIYANCLGVLGGMIIAMGLLHIPPAAYWVEMRTIVDLPDISVGLIKAFAFGLIVGIAGCLRGLQADRSAAGVGRAATSAVVTAILWIIVADALFAVLFEALGL